MAIGLFMAAVGTEYVTYVISACVLGIGLSLANVALNALASLVVPENEQARAMATYSAGMDGGIMEGSFMIAILLNAGLELPVILMILVVLSFITVLNTPGLRRMERMSRNQHGPRTSSESP
jgi:MFS family permease